MDDAGTDDTDDADLHDADLHDADLHDADLHDADLHDAGHADLDDAGHDDPFDLERFVTAQDAGGTYDAALRELRAGRKTSHWMWFVFPQLAGLGRSATARRYALRGSGEALAYAAHPVLGPRLRECARALTALPTRDPVAVLGSVDASKLRSSMTLFAAVAPQEPVFREVLDRCFDGQDDPLTRELLGGTAPPATG